MVREKTHGVAWGWAGVAALALVTASVGVGAPAIAQDDSVDGATMVVRARGARGWTAGCTLDTDRGREARPQARGRGAASSGVLVGRDVVGGSCTAEAGDRGPLELVFEDERGAFVCPFNGEDECRVVIGTGQALTFSIALK